MINAGMIDPKALAAFGGGAGSSAMTQQAPVGGMDMNKIIMMLIEGLGGGSKQPAIQQPSIQPGAGYKIGDMQAPTQQRFDYGDMIKKAMMMGR